MRRLQKLSRSMFLAVVGLALGASAAQPWFGVSFDGYADGETLSDRGASGGSWGELPTADAPAVKVTDGDRASLDVQGKSTTNGVTFTAASAAGDVSWAMTLPLKFSHAMDLEGFTPDGPISFTVAYDDADAFRFAGWAGGAWHFLDAADISASTNVWYDLIIESRDIGGEEYVGFALVTDGEVRHELSTASGCRWFAVGRKVSADVRTVTFAGRGRCGAFDGARETSEPTSVLHWIGGAAGDWNVATNWSETAGGEPAGRCPAAGEGVRVGGTVALVRGGESATVTDFLAGVKDDGSLDLWSGTFLTSVSLDTSRVRAGKKLEAVSVPFGGLVNPVMATWSHAPMTTKGAKDSYAQVAKGASFVPQAADYESWFKCAYSVEGGPVETKEFFFSKLPVIYLATDSGSDPPADKTKVDGTIRTQGNDEFSAPIEDDMATTINVRGNTTASKTKKPWKLKLDEKTKMFGLGDKSKHWVLLANAMDPSGYRNKLAYDFANEIGGFAMLSTFVSVFMNGTYRGVYQLCQHVRVAEDRVNVYDWESAGEDVAKALVKSAKLSDEAKDALKEEMSTNFQWVTSGQVAYGGATYNLGDYVKDFASYTNDISGGYLFELDGKSGDELTTFKTTKTGQLPELPVAVSSPETLKTNPRMVDKGKSILDAFFAATTAVDGYKGGKHFSELADMNSLVTYYLTMELTGNYDSKGNSRFAYVDRGGPLVFGPVWDCDLAFASPGNTFDEPAHNPERWIVLNSNTAFYKEWIDDPYFCKRVRDCWRTTARAAYSNMLAKIETWNVDLAQPFAADEKRWPSSSASYKMATDRKTLVDFITRRLAWVDKQFADLPTMMASLKEGTGSVSSTHPYEKDEEALVIDVRRGVQGPYAKVSVANAAVAKVAVYLDGLKVGGAQAVGADGAVRVSLPSERLSKLEDSCLEVIASAADGKTVVARNYLLVRRPKGGLAVIFK